MIILCCCRYGPRTYEWIAVAVASGFIMLVTGLMLLVSFINPWLEFVNRLLDLRGGFRF